jgi:hypothetical protein
MAVKTMDIFELQNNNLIDLADCQIVQTNDVFTPMDFISIYKNEPLRWSFFDLPIDTKSLLQNREDFDDVLASREAKVEGTRIPYSQVRGELGLK